MKKLKQYNEKEIKALVIEYNALANDMFQTNEASMRYLLGEVSQDQNFILPYISLAVNVTNNGHPGRLYLEWSGGLAKVDVEGKVFGSINGFG